ncbi:MAG: FAD-dependent oxidoreductase, partial [Acetobacteraceae bacterium]
RHDGMVVARVADGREVRADAILMATGRRPVTSGLGLDAVGVATGRVGEVVVDAGLRTANPRIWAAGDVTGAAQFVYVAAAQGALAADNAIGKLGRTIDWTGLPKVTFTTPQIASVGLTEARAKEAGHEVKIGRFPFIGNGKAIALGEPEGMIKTVFDAKTGELLGAHMVGAEVTEMIQGYTIARTLESTEAELMHTVFPHPTISEAMHEAVLDAYGRAIHF